MSRLSIGAAALLIGGGLFHIIYDPEGGFPLGGCPMCWLKLFIDIFSIFYGAVLIFANFSKKEIPAVTAGK